MCLASHTHKWQLSYLRFHCVAGLSRLREEARYLQEHALADNSLKTRRSQWKDYHEFCATYDVTPLPCTEEGVCLYVAYMTRKFKYSSIEGYVSALSYLQQMHGYAPINASNFMVKRTMLGAKRKLGYSPVQAMPLRPEHLLQFYAQLDMCVSFHLCWWTAAITAFRGLLRKAHITKSSQCICVNNVKFYEWGFAYPASYKNHPIW